MQWIDAAGRTVKTKDPYGSITQFEYDANGQLRKQRIFAASNDPTFTTRETQFQYDALGRQRVVITLGSDPQYQATDYFNPGDGGADGWDQVDFLPLPGSDPTASVANLKSRATKSIYDSIGKLLYVQAPDPSLLNNGTTLPSAKWPAQLFTYSYDTTAQTLTTKRELGLVTNGPTSPSIDLSAPNVRKTQTIDNSSGETIEVERWVPGTSSPTSGSFILVSKSQYNSAGEKIHTWTPLGGSDATALTQTDFRYDSQSRLISTKNISGETKQEFDGYGNLVTTTDALNDMTKHSYDKLNRLLATKEASGAQQSMTFNGRAKTHTIDENATTSIEYDLLGRVESRTPPGRGKIKYKYDTVGNLLSIEDGEGLTTTWTYDSLNRPRTETDSNGFITKKIYDLAGNLISVVDPLGHETISVYDALNRLVSTTDALQYTTYMSYDASGNRLSLTDPENNKTQWTYDSFDRVLTETNQLNNTRSYAYYSDGRERLLTKADGNQIRYTYDLAAHTSKEEWLNGSGAVTKTLDFEYNAVGDLLDASDSDSSVHWLYESGLLRQESLSLPNNISVQFVNRYKDDVLQSVTTKLGGIQDSKVAYSYTADGLLEQIQQTGYNVSTKSVRYSYDQAARRTRVTRFTDVDNLTAVFRTDYRYTNTSNQQTDRLQSLKHKTALSSLVEYKFVWDAASRLKSVESPGGDGLSSFTYDTVNQLTGATYSSNISNLSFSYDSNGNRNNADNVPGVDNRQQSDSEWTYQYDDNGNLVRQTNKSNGSVVEYTFDVRNRLTDVSFRGSLGGTLTKGVHYGYDAINRRISRALDSNGDGSADVMEYFVNYGQRASRGGAGDELALVLKGDGEVKTRVLHGALVDEVLAEENVTSPTNRDVLWALADQQGSVRDLARVTNGQVQVVDHIQYDAFGNTVSETDTAIAHLYGYTGREFDKETGLQYNRARYYDPSNGRLLSKDPIGFGGGDTNLYRMTGNHPNMATDPSGLFDDGLMTLNLNPTRGELEAGRRLELESMIGAIEESNALRATEERARGRSKLLRGLGVPESLEHLYGEVKYEALEFFGWVNAIERENAESASYREYLRRRNDAKAVFIGVSILGGSIETGTGIALSIAGLGSPITVLGVAMTAHGGDGLTATIRSMGSDEPIDTFTSQTFQAAGMPRGYANLADAGVGIGLGLGAGGLLRSARLASPVSTVETLTHRNGIYEVVSQQAITGTSRSAHRASANRSLLESIDNDPVLSRQLGNILGVDDVAAHMRTGRSALRNPPGTEWHHPIDNPGVMQLLRRPVHRHSELQNILHPDNIGGFGTHFGN